MATHNGWNLNPLSYTAYLQKCTDVLKLEGGHVVLEGGYVFLKHEGGYVVLKHEGGYVVLKHGMVIQFQF